MLLTNINGTSDTNCSCGSWLKHWQNYNPNNQKPPTYCPVENCLNKDLVGAHVQKNNILDRSWYICPLCNKHNQSTKSLEVGDFISLAPANKGETCRKPKSYYQL